MSRELSVSMMCIDLSNLGEMLRTFEDEGVNYLHVDVMDGHFVPNLMLGTTYVEWLKNNSRIPLDIHLMVEDPAAKLDWFPIGPGDMVTVHVESAWNVLDSLIHIRKLGAKAVLAISPQTPITSVIHLLDYVDGVCVMLVIPGFSGQTMIKGMEEKIRALSDYRRSSGSEFFIEADGHIHEDNIRSLEALGVDVFVAGTSLLGEHPGKYRERIRLFYSI